MHGLGFPVQRTGRWETEGGFPRPSWLVDREDGLAFQKPAFSRCHRPTKVPGYYDHNVQYRSLVSGAAALVVSRCRRAMYDNTYSILRHARPRFPIRSQARPLSRSELLVHTKLAYPFTGTQEASGARLRVWKTRFLRAFSCSQRVVVIESVDGSEPRLDARGPWGATRVCLRASGESSSRRLVAGGDRRQSTCENYGVRVGTAGGRKGGARGGWLTIDACLSPPRSPSSPSQAAPAVTLHDVVNGRA